MIVDLLGRPGLLILFAAIGYALATYLMKLSAQSVNFALLGMIGFALAVSVVAEILLLQRMTLGVAYLSIIAAESLLVLGLAWTIGDGLSHRAVFGGVLVVAGTMLVSA